MARFSFVQDVTVLHVNTDYSVQRELYVSADSVRDARELFAEYVQQLNNTAHFKVSAVGEVMNTFEDFGAVGATVHMRECK